MLRRKQHIYSVTLTLHMPDGNKRGLKHNSDAHQVLETVKSKAAGVESSLSNHRDVKPFIQYMTEATFMV